MKIAIMPCRSTPRGLKMLVGCLLLCLLTCMPASAQEENITRVGASLKDYAEFSFAVPKEFGDMFEGESRFEANYTKGRYVTASLLLNESRISLYLIYPCQAPETELDAAGLKSLVNGFTPVLNQTVYSSLPLNIDDKTAVWGQIGNQILVAYQPSNETFSLTFIDVNLTEDALEYLPESLKITVNDGSSPLWPGYCAGDAVQTEPVSGKEQMTTDLEAVRAQMMNAFKYS